MGIFGTFFSIQANIITNFGPDSWIDMSGGIFIRGFSIEIYPDFYSPNIIPALADLKNVNKSFDSDLDQPIAKRLPGVGWLLIP